MKRRGKFLAAAVLATLLSGAALLGGSVFAADEPGGPPHGMGGGPRCEDMAAHEAGMLAFARVKLGITDAQKSIWSQFEDKVKAADAPMRQQCEAEHADRAHGPMTLPERMGKMETELTAHLQHMKALRAAVEFIYPQLTDEQRKIADHEFDHMGGPHGGPWHHEGGPDGGPPHGGPMMAPPPKP